VSLWLRPTQHNEEAISKYADMGVSGFMIPNVIELPRLQKVVNQAYFAPIAKTKAKIRRGYSMGEVVLDAQSLANIKKEMGYANRNMIVTLQTEHTEGIANLSKLLSLRGVLGTIIGPNDLAISLSQLPGSQDLIKQGLSKMYRDKRMMDSYRKIGQIASEHCKVAGIHFTRKEELGLVKDLVENMDYRLILLGTEENFYCSDFLETKDKIEQIGRRPKE
jgi:2-keto-3-deoxy-L-rhamnonate aldolase RhmA